MALVIIILAGVFFYFYSVNKNSNSENISFLKNEFMRIYVDNPVVASAFLEYLIKSRISKKDAIYLATSLMVDFEQSGMNVNQIKNEIKHVISNYYG